MTEAVQNQPSVEKKRRPLVRYFVALIIFAAAVAAHWPIFRAGMFESDEIVHWPRRLSEFDFALRHGQLWPRWFANLEMGYGYPFPNFYAPGGLWLSWLCYLPTRSYLWGVKGAFLVAGLLAPWGMYRWLRPRVSRLAALVGALLYLLAPYHILNFLVRGNLAEYLAMGLFPWVLWGLSRLDRRRDVMSFTLSSLILGAYLLTHTLSAFFGMWILLGVVLMDGILNRRSFKSYIVKFSLLATGVLLTTIYWFPAIWDMQYVRVANVMEQIVAADHVIYPLQLLDPRWGFGYSLPGPHDELSLQMGLPHFAGVVLAVVAFLGRRGEKNRRELALWIAMCLVLVLVEMPLAAPLWHLPVLRMIQFPWRLLAWVAVATSALGAYAVDAWKFNRLPWIFIVMASILTLCLYVRPEFIRPVEDWGFAPEITRQMPGNTTAGEYLPRGVLQLPDHRSRQTLIGFLDERGISNVEFIDGNVFDQSFRVNNPDNDSIDHFPTLFPYEVFEFPNWVMEVNGVSRGIAYNTNGIVLISPPGGQSVVRVHWTATLAHRLSALVSQLTLLALLVLSYLSQRRSRRRQLLGD